MPRRVLVTGGAGFIGSAVVRRLIAATSDEVLVVDKLTYAGNLSSLREVSEEPRFEFLRADIADEPAMRGAFASFDPDLVLHLAAESHVDRSITGPQAFIDLLRQRARPYLFSNSLAPSIVCATLAALELLEESADLRRQLAENTAYFRERMTAAGFDVIPGEHAIAPVMTGDAKLAQQLASGLMEQGVYVTAFSFPVVPKDQARVRTQLSAGLSREQIDHAIAAFIRVGQQVGLIPAGDGQ